MVYAATCPCCRVKLKATTLMLVMDYVFEFAVSFQPLRERKSVIIDLFICVCFVFVLLAYFTEFFFFSLFSLCFCPL